eukprot:8186351-Pyramimonas_sp.AAC.1
MNRAGSLNHSRPEGWWDSARDPNQSLGRRAPTSRFWCEAPTRAEAVEHQNRDFGVEPQPEPRPTDAEIEISM